jgi:hypothetical protein
LPQHYRKKRYEYCKNVLPFTRYVLEPRQMVLLKKASLTGLALHFRQYMQIKPYGASLLPEKPVL